MPKKAAIARARADARAGKKPTTQAGEFVREEMRELEKGNPRVRSRKQAIAIGLSEARRSGVKVAAPARGKASAGVRKKAAQDLKRGKAKQGSKSRASAGRHSGASRKTAKRSRSK